MNNNSKNIFTVNGRFYYGWVMLLCAFMPMFICFVVKTYCLPLVVGAIQKELNITKTAWTQTNTIMTIAMMITSLFIGKIYKKGPFKWVLVACVALTSLCFLAMSRATALWQFYLLYAIQGIGWAGATNLPATIMGSNWFGPKIKGTALSIAMLGSGAGALVWNKIINTIITNSGWRSGYVAMAAVNAIVIIVAILLVVGMPADKGFETRVGDPEPSEGTSGVSIQKTGLTGQQALKTKRWWCQWLAGLTTMIGASGFTYYGKLYLTEVLPGGNNAAIALYSAVVGTLVIGKFLLGIVTDLINVKRSSVIAPLFYAGFFVCLFMGAVNPVFFKIMIPIYMIGGSVPSVIPFLVTARNFGDKEYGVMSGWMNMAGNVGQIIGPTMAAIIVDTTGSYHNAWLIFALLMGVVAVLYLFSGIVDKKKIADMGYNIPA